MNIPGFEPSDTPTAEHQIEGAEAVLGVTFPRAYRELVHLYGGADGDADFSLASGHEANIGGWLSLSPWNSQSVWSALSYWPEHQLPTNIIPFGIDGGGGGNYVCFQYSSSGEPSVVLWFHELQGLQGIQPVAPSFDVFLGGLRAARA